MATPTATRAALPLESAALAAVVRGESLDDFYVARDQRPLWLDPDAAGDAPRLLIHLLRSSAADGLNPEDYRPDKLEQALGAIPLGDDQALLHLDRMLSQVFLDYVRDLKRPRLEMIWVDNQLRPSSPSPRRLLDAAAATPSLERWLASMRWMNPIYAGLREAIANGAGGTSSERDLLRLNLERARVLPTGDGRYVLVDAATARLTMFENGEAIDSMRVVVGKPAHPTPMMAALIRFTSLNPYWNVPPDLAAERVAPNVIKSGPTYLKANGYQLLSTWDSSAELVDPNTVDWTAVAAGQREVRLRQLPGPSNAMGTMKFMFPNAQGIYLHDTPQKELLSEASRMFSGGCVRLEDAPRLARWLHDGRVPTTSSTAPEQRVDLPRPVPVFITYLTAMPRGSEVAYFPDVYGRDQAALATLAPGGRRAAY